MAEVRIFLEEREESEGSILLVGRKAAKQGGISRATERSWHGKFTDGCEEEEVKKEGARKEFV